MEPVADRAAAATVRSSLQAVGYDERHIVELLGDDGPGADAEDVVVFDRRLPTSNLATVVRLLLLQLPVPERDLTARIRRGRRRRADRARARAAERRR